jgi:AAA domain/DnaB-like helicase N terminal domain
MMVDNDRLPPSCPEAERGVLGCCLLDTGKTAIALKAGVNSRWFYDLRHIEIFNVLAAMARNGGGDSLVATLKLRELGKLDHIGGPAYLSELQDAVPSAENLEFYLPDLRAYFQRRQVIDIGTRLRLLAQDPAADPATLFADTGNLLQHLQAQAEAAALPEIVHANDFLAADIPTPPEIVSGVLHQGSKLILGGYSKSYKTWTLADLALSVATGMPWLGFETIAGKVLYVNLEIQAGFFRNRVMKMADAKHLELKEQPDIWNLRGHPADYRVLLPKIRNRIRDEGYSLVIIDPTYKLLGIADENSATDITALLNMVDTVATTTGAAVVLAGHFAKGNASAKETIDRISGSGVFARDPDSLVIFTKHEEEGAFVVEMILRNLPPVKPFVVKWQYPLFVREGSLDPARLKHSGGRPPKHTPEMLLECLGNQRLTATEWQIITHKEHGVPESRFYELKKGLETAKEIAKSVIDDKWEKIRKSSGNWYDEKDQ